MAHFIFLSSPWNVPARGLLWGLFWWPGLARTGGGRRAFYIRIGFAVVESSQTSFWLLLVQYNLHFYRKECPFNVMVGSEASGTIVL